MVLDWSLFASVFGVIALAELPDKTIFATLVLASQGRPLATFVGVAAAFFIQSLIAICFGQVLGFLPPQLVQGLAALLFFVFSYFMWTGEADAADHEKLKANSGYFFQSFWNSFLVIFVAEWGDLTQLATAAFQARYHQALTIFLAATSALWAVTAVGVLLGSQLGKWVDPVKFRKLAAVLFALMGLVFLIKIFV